MPRIISGVARGTRLLSPRGMDTRPTGDKVKEALFSILMPRLPAEGFLDLFAGTGQIGLEAASRGSNSVFLVERSATSLAAIRSNIEKTRLGDRVTVLAEDAAVALRRLHREGHQFDLVFMDPPYNEAIKLFTRMADDLTTLLRQGGLLILEHDANEAPPAFVTNLQLSRSCQYGTAMLSFYKAEDSANS